MFGVANDHATRVIPAFVKAVYEGADLNVEGGDNAFDFTFVDEVVRALGLLVTGLQRGQRYQPMHFTTGYETSLNTPASTVIELFQSQSRMIHHTPRDFDVSRFSESTDLAFQQLGWRHEEQSLTYFLRQYAERLGMLNVKSQTESIVCLSDREKSAVCDNEDNCKLKMGQG